MKQFMDKDFLLTTDSAKALFHNYAEKMPVLDYHCHINPREIAEDRKFENITQVWLGGDHYKWRQMRSNGVDEKYITRYGCVISEGTQSDESGSAFYLELNEKDKTYKRLLNAGKESSELSRGTFTRTKEGIETVDKDNNKEKINVCKESYS